MFLICILICHTKICGIHLSVEFYIYIYSKRGPRLWKRIVFDFLAFFSLPLRLSLIERASPSVACLANQTSEMRPKTITNVQPVCIIVQIVSLLFLGLNRGGHHERSIIILVDNATCALVTPVRLKRRTSFATKARGFCVSHIEYRCWSPPPQSTIHIYDDRGLSAAVLSILIEINILKRFVKL